MSEIKTLFPPGHFYSPICDPHDLIERERKIWPAHSGPPADPSFDYNVPQQMELLADFAAYVSDITFPRDASGDPHKYYYSNDQFPCLDAEVLFCMLRHYAPRNIIEVGSGFSTLVMAEVSRRFFDAKLNLICIEPYPQQFLIDGVPGVSRLIRNRVQYVEPDLFTQLTANDVLFIDSSHVSKTGSDVNQLMFDIVSRLRPGVLVHFHDIFLPDDYPRIWSIDQGRNWNEQYLVRAFLQFNSAFEIVWSSYVMCTRYPERASQIFPRFPSLGGGGSLWIRRRPD